MLFSLIVAEANVAFASRDVTNSWLRQNRISEYGEYGQKWAIFVFSKRKMAFFSIKSDFLNNLALKTG